MPRRVSCGRSSSSEAAPLGPRFTVESKDFCERFWRVHYRLSSVETESASWRELCQSLPGHSNRSREHLHRRPCRLSGPMGRLRLLIMSRAAPHRSDRSDPGSKTLRVVEPQFIAVRRIKAINVAHDGNDETIVIQVQCD